jgi:hypothetical protein
MSSVDWKALAESAGDGGFEALPVGDYDLKCVNAEKTQTANGKLMFKCKFEVQTGQYKKRLVWHNFVVSPESDVAMGIFFRQMSAFGMTKEWFKTMPSEETIVNTLQGRDVRAKLGIKKYNGEDRNEISAFAVVPVGGNPPPPGATSAAAPPPPPPAPAAATPPPPPAPAPAPAAAPAPAPAPVAAEVAAPAPTPAPEPAPAPAEAPAQADVQADIPIPPPPSF